MNIGVPKEIKNNENRVGLTPAGVASYVAYGHKVFVETNAGMGSGFTNEEYENAGATIVDSAAKAWDQDMVIKVKEPIASEYGFFKEGLILYTYLHLAPELELTKHLLDKKVIGIAYETVQLPDGSLPLLTPMSEVAGRMSVQIGAHLLEKPQGGMGKMLGGVSGVDRGRVTIVGGGVSGINAAKMAVGMGARVKILDINLNRLREIDDIFQGSVETLMSNPYNIAKCVKDADLLIGAVLIPGAKAPTLVSEEMVKSMKPGSVIVDIAIDQGGSIETVDRITTHENPSYVTHGVVHYSVANMPGALPQTSTYALNNATLPYGLKIANMGAKEALLSDDALLKGLNTYNGHVTYKAVAEDQGLEYVDPKKALEA